VNLFIYARFFKDVKEGLAVYICICLCRRRMFLRCTSSLKSMYFSYNWYGKGL